jgi:hypothetical protein
VLVRLGTVRIWVRARISVKVKVRVRESMFHLVSKGPSAKCASNHKLALYPSA